MNDFAQTQSEARAGKINKKGRKQISIEIGNEIDREKFKKEEEERIKQRVLLEREEKGNTSQLLTLGKLCYLVEAFDLISLKDQEIPAVGPFDDPTQTKSFRQGYEVDGPRLKANFTEEHYHAFRDTYEAKYNKNSSKGK